jgi:glycine hydroxymethyltransferase
VPNDDEKPFVTSGIRLGTPALTSRGFDETAMREVARLIFDALMNPTNENVLDEVRRKVKKLTNQFPLYL